MERYDVAVHHVVPLPGQLEGVPAGAAADVGHHRGRGRQVLGEHVERAQVLDLAERLAQPLLLLAALVVVVQRMPGVHHPMLPARAASRTRLDRVRGRGRPRRRGCGPPCPGRCRWP